MTPFAVITDETTGVKYPLADYELMPKMAIIDSDLMTNMPKGLTSASGIDAMTHALEAYASVMATDFTDGLALKALKSIFTYLPRAYNDGANDPGGQRENVHRFHGGRYGFRQCVPGRLPLHGTQAGRVPSSPHGVANAPTHHPT